jgi:ribose transport system permease protein
VTGQGRQPAHVAPEAGAIPAARIRRSWPVAQLAATLALFVVGAATLEDFTARRSIYAMLVLASLLGLATLGQTLCILVNGIDLSVGAWIGAGAVMLVQLDGTYGWPFGFAVALIAGCAVAAGSVVGYVCARWRIDPLIVTLGMSAIVSGGLLVWAQGLITGTPPQWLQRFTSPAGTIWGVGFPPVVAVWLVVAFAVSAVLNRTPAGRRMYAVGVNRRAAELALVRVRLVSVAVYAVSALFAALTGILLAGFAGAADGSLGTPYLWHGLTAVMVGGTAFGGRGDYTRTVLGCILLIELSTILVGHGLTTSDQQIVDGVLLFLVLGWYGRDARLGDRL